MIINFLIICTKANSSIESINQKFQLPFFGRGIYYFAGTLNLCKNFLESILVKIQSLATSSFQ